MQNDRHQHGLRNGALDICQSGEGILVHDQKRVDNLDDRVGIVCRTDHPLATRADLSSRDLEDAGWVAHSRGSLLRQQTEGALIAMGVERIDVAVETDSIQSVLEIVSETDLISTMPRVTTCSYMTPRLRFLKLVHPQFHRPIGIIRRADAAPNKLRDEFVRTLLERDGTGVADPEPGLREGQA